MKTFLVVMYLSASLMSQYRSIFGSEEESPSSDTFNRNPDEIGVATNWVNPYVTRLTTTVKVRTPRPRSLIYKALLEYQQAQEMLSSFEQNMKN